MMVIVNLYFVTLLNPKLIVPQYPITNDVNGMVSNVKYIVLNYLKHNVFQDRKIVIGNRI